MKPTKITLLTVLLAGIAFISAGFVSTKAPSAPGHKYTGHWIVKSGEEWIEAGKADIPEQALQFDEEGKMKGFDKNRVSEALRANSPRSISGRNIDASIYVFGVDEPSDNAMNLVGAFRKKGLNKTSAPDATGSQTLSMAHQAALTCYNGYPYSGNWTLYGGCNTSSRCTAIYNLYALYYVWCTAAN